MISATSQIGPEILAGATLRLWRDLDLGQPSGTILQTLIAETPWRQDRITLFGKTHDQPRLTAWFGDPDATYRYSGLSLTPLPWTNLLHDLKTRVEDLVQSPFNSVLLNLYRDGRDSMGLHSDDERELGPNPVITSLSLGATRRMVFRARHSKDRMDLDLTDASLLLMSGETQSRTKHEIPKQKRITAPRINLTFRRIMAPRITGSG